MKKITVLMCVVVLSVLSICGVCYASQTEMTPDTSGMPSWTELLKKYRNEDEVKALIFVQATSGSDARVLVYKKDKSDNTWELSMECDAYIGKTGIGEDWKGKQSEGDDMTPVGDYGVTTAFGIKENPGTSLEYIDVTDSVYACGDQEYYNQIIDTSKLEHTCSDASEHMIDYSPQYNYGFAIDYNPENEFGKGSAIFFHCKGAAPYTGGCIAVDQENMKDILGIVDSATRVCIYPIMR